MQATLHHSAAYLSCCLWLSCLFVLLPTASLAQPTEERTMLVAAAPCPPTVTEKNGELNGLGIFLWSRVAAEMGVRYEIKQTSLDNMLANIGNPEEERRADVGISCVSITAEHERIVDFSHSVLPYELETQNYGFAMQDNSPLTEPLNLALLVVRRSGEWHAALREYLGE